MTSVEHERAIALQLAQRAYSYSLFHVVFGVKPSKDIADTVFTQDTVNNLNVYLDILKQPSMANVADKKLQGTTITVAQAIKNTHAYLTQYMAGEGTAVEDLITQYTRFFMVPGPSYVYPWESTYTNSNKMMMQESTLEVRQYYHEAGFKLQSEKHFPDDHIAAMMDYLGRMSQRAYEAYADGNDAEVCSILKTQATFINAHILNWIGEFIEKLMKCEEDSPYKDFACCMAAIVFIDMQFIIDLTTELA